MTLGTNSLGWAIIGLVDGVPANLLRAGVRVFEAGMDGNMESGQEESRNLKRREARLHRRQLWRRSRRLRKIFNLLQSFGLLPRGDASTAEKRQDFINQLDQSIRTSEWFKVVREKFPVPDQALPYILRACALDERLDPWYLGRALYHLAQRRGYKSNRKAPPKKDEKPGEVEKGIGEIREGMAQTQSHTLGEYLARLDPFVRRIRQRWTDRKMFLEEFESLWGAQARYRPDELTPLRRKKLHAAMFYQRPLWFPKGLVGKCDLETAEPRAPKYSFLAQRFRLLDSVNNLKLDIGSGERCLTAEERSALIEELELNGDLTFSHVRKRLLKLPPGSVFTIERGGEKTLRGNRTTSKFYGVFGERWLEMSAAEHDQALQDLLSIENSETLARRGLNYWKLDEAAAKKFAAINIEPDYFNWSVRAMEKLLPLLETGITSAEARRQLYPEKFQARPVLDWLPGLDSAESRQAVGEVRNPAVTRSLTELRKVVNAIIRQYGKPVQIRIELARDLKRSRKDRKALSDRMRENEKGRADAKKRILEAEGIPHPRRDDVRKALLWDECGGVCPYTGKPIPFKNLFGDAPQFDIEHIIPFERCFDDSFNNLTLCDVHENRHGKRGRTPWEAYGNTELWEDILDRVRRFHSGSARAKLRRFQMTETEASEFVDKFIARQLADTRYASRLAAQYVAMLFGGLSDDLHQRRVHVTSGELTAKLRAAWKLNGILNDGPSSGGGERPKTREDHRHHAVDAVAIALTDDSTIQGLSRAASIARERAERKLASLEGPWPNFVDSVRKEIDSIVVSHRVSKKISGALHEETVYSRPMNAPGTSERQPRAENGGAGDNTPSIVHVRKQLDTISKPEVEAIVDPSVRKLVQDKLVSLGNGDPKKLFSLQTNLPFFQTKDGRRIPIKRVRVKKAVPVFSLGSGRSVRHVASESNHHVEIYAEVDGKGKEGKWDGEVISLQETVQRVRSHKPVVQRDHGPLVKFKFSLAPGEVIECNDRGNGSALFVMRKASLLCSGQLQIGFAPIRDARKAKEMQQTRSWLWANPNSLRLRNPRKVVISPIGEVSEAHD